MIKHDWRFSYSDTAIKDAVDSGNLFKVDIKHINNFVFNKIDESFEIYISSKIESKILNAGITIKAMLIDEAISKLLSKITFHEKHGASTVIIFNFIGNFIVLYSVLNIFVIVLLDEY